MVSPPFNNIHQGSKILQKIENIYLAILGVAVIVIAGLLLAPVVIYGLNSFQGFSQFIPDAQPLVVTSDNDSQFWLITILFFSSLPIFGHKTTENSAGKRDQECWSDSPQIWKRLV